MSPWCYGMLQGHQRCSRDSQNASGAPGMLQGLTRTWNGKRRQLGCSGHSSRCCCSRRLAPESKMARAGVPSSRDTLYWSPVPGERWHHPWGWNTPGVARGAVGLALGCSGDTLGWSKGSLGTAWDIQETPWDAQEHQGCSRNNWDADGMLQGHLGFLWDTLGFSRTP